MKTSGGGEIRRMSHASQLVVIVFLVGTLGILPFQFGGVPSAHAAWWAQRSDTPEHRSILLGRKTTTARIYLVAINDNGKSGRKFGCGDSLVAVTRPITPTTAPLSAAMRLLLSDHRRNYGQSGLYNALYRSRLRLQRASIAHGKATIYLAGTLRLGGVCDNPRVGAQLRQTARQFSTVQSVGIFINNVPLWKRLSMKG